MAFHVAFARDAASGSSGVSPSLIRIMNPTAGVACAVIQFLPVKGHAMPAVCREGMYDHDRKQTYFRRQIIVMVVGNPEALKPKLKCIGGSQSDEWNNFLANQTVTPCGWLTQARKHRQQRSATVAALVGIAPRDELEGMMAAQLIATHNASMECYRRAMIAEQTFEARRENLNQANKLSRTYASGMRQGIPRASVCRGARA